MNKLNIVTGLVVAVGLSACGGGTTAPVGQTGTPAFSTFSAVGANDTVTLNGTTISGGYTTNGSGDVTSIDGASLRQSVADSAEIGFVSSAMRAVATRSGPSSVSFDTKTGDSVVPQRDLLVFGNASGARLVALDPQAVGQDHQIAMTWTTGIGTGAGQVGAGSFGSVTPSGAARVGSAATYSGKFVGARGAVGSPTFLTEGDADLKVNFNSSTFTLETYETRVTNVNTGALNGFVSNRNFAGTINGSTLTGAPVTGVGTVVGSFYGPNGEEVGGTFGITSSSSAAIGAFGAKRTSVTP